VTRFECGNFSTCDVPRPGRLKTVTTLEIIDQIHELIWEYCRISAKSIAEQLSILRVLVGSIIHEPLDMRELSAMWVPKCLTRITNVDGAKRLRNIWIFLAHSKLFSVAIGDHGRNMVTAV
jgi:hypothetical protein